MRALLIGTSIAVCALGASSVSASAAISCVDNVCWHTTERYSYPAEAKVKIYEDTWKPAPGVSIRWRERTGRGYWRGDSWVEF